MIKAIVGAGGKTGYIRRKATEAVLAGQRVFVTTTTHMYAEEGTLMTDQAEAVISRLKESGYVMAGQGFDDKDGMKIKGLPDDVYSEICRHADLVLVESDGSRHLPLKWPAETEPVIPDNADEIVVVCGLHGLGQTADKAVHRLELAKHYIDIQDDTVIVPHHIKELVMKGYVIPLREQYPDKEISILAVHDNSLYQRAVAKLIEDGADVSLIEKSWFAEQPKLIVCGGGHVSRALVRMAALLDFKIKVIDDRDDFANVDRFPDADQVICDEFTNLSRYLEDDGFYVVVTREHKDDYVCIKTILGSSYEYLGMIGSKGKVAKNLEQLRNEGVSEELISTVFAPIGLDIKAVTPAEIAVSILAQIIDEKNKQARGSASKKLLDVSKPGTLCIIIEKKGSSPRGKGSMMFVAEDEVIDSIGGGAVEFAAIEDARNCDRCMIKEYKLNQEDLVNLGMICGGTNKVLFIPLK